MNIQNAEALWPKVIEFVKARRMSTGIFLSESEPVEINDSTVILGLPSEFQFHKETLQKEPNRRLVEEGFEAVVGRKVRVQFVVTEGPREQEASEPEPAEDTAPQGGGPEHEIIDQALSVFKGARFVRRQ